MKCGEVIEVKDWAGSYRMRLIAQCGGRFMLVTYGATDPRNGYLLADWQAALRELVAVAVPAALVGKLMTVSAAPGGMYAAIPLSYPLSLAGLASVLGEPADQVRAVLEDLAVQVV